MDDVGTDLAARVLHQLLHLLQVGVDVPCAAPPPEGVEACISQVHVALHRLGVAAHRWAADQAQRVRSYDANISMISVGFLAKTCSPR